MSRWTPDQDRDQRDVAAALSRRHAPYWWVMWSLFFREWVGFYLGRTRSHRSGTRTRTSWPSE